MIQIVSTCKVPKSRVPKSKVPKSKVPKSKVSTIYFVLVFRKIKKSKAAKRKTI